MHSGQVRMSRTPLNELLHELRAPTPPLPQYDQDKVDEAVLALLYLTAMHEHPACFPRVV
jgi:hypothetical protein